MLELEGKRVTVMGLGRFGGGVGVTRFLCAYGADVLLTDLQPADKLANSLDQLRDLIDAGTVTLRLGEHNVSDFTNTDLVVANPAVPKPWDNRFLRAASAASVPITTEIRLLCERLPNRAHVIGVTGTAGKSTTSAMIAHILKADGRTVHFGGNIGGSLLPELDNITPEDWIVLELSSAQLYWLGRGVGYPEAPAWSPGVAVITNIAPNHLDWHADMAHYAESKMRILEPLSDADTAIVGTGVTLHITNHERTRRMRLFDHTMVGECRLRLPGAHNRVNAAVAIQAAAAAGIDAGCAHASLSTFEGLPHRLQLVEVDGSFRAFNDSKCTTPEACALAVRAFDETGEVGRAHIHLICGGYDKKIDLAPMIEAASGCAGVYTIGATGPEIARRINLAHGHAKHCESLDNAVEQAMHAINASGGSAVLLLSPGCASWDQFTNYEERGERFARLVRAYCEGGSKSIVT